mgnify:CR=1 FL=1
MLSTHTLSPYLSVDMMGNRWVANGGNSGSCHHPLKLEKKTELCTTHNIKEGWINLA